MQQAVGSRHVGVRSGAGGCPVGRRALLLGLVCVGASAQQPARPVDITPIDGETYYIINQQTGLQVDLNAGSTAQGASILAQPRSFTSLNQRWAMTRLAAGTWEISNLGNGLCLDSANAGSATGGSMTGTVQNTCTAVATQQWALGATSNGYYTLTDQGTGLLLDLSGSAAGSPLIQTALATSATQSQQWLLRAAFFRGIDNALLEKQEANKVANGVPWWNDAGQPQDVLKILKNHGVNMVRVRPTTVPPYATYTSTSCSGNGCYAETDAQDVNLAVRAKNLGMAVQLSFLFDGGSSVATPGAWSADTLTQAGTDLYNYVKAEVEAFRVAGAMPDMVSIGNEVDTGFLNSLGSSPNASFANFAALEKQGMQAVLDASSDTSVGPALPAPLRCIHVTPAYNLSSFFTNANNYGIPYDAMCQSYYPIYHGPLTAVQAAAANPNNKAIEQNVLTAATTLGKPIFLIEVGEHYESGFGTNDPWYGATIANQRQFLIDVNGVLKGLPNNLGMGMEYWNATGVNVFIKTGGYSNGDGRMDALYTWNGLTLFDNADTQGYSNASLANFSAALPGLDALGGKEDAALQYKLVNEATGQILETPLASTAQGAMLDTAVDTGVESQHQQWVITSNSDGYFRIANGNAGSGTNVLDSSGSATAGTAVVQNAATSATASQEWNVVTGANGYFALVNRSSGLALTATAPTSIQQTTLTSLTTDWAIAANTNQLWQIVPVHVSATSVPAQLQFAAGTPSTVARGSSPGTISVSVTNTAGAVIGSPQESVTLNLTGPGNFAQTSTASSAGGVATFDLGGVTLTAGGTYTLTASAAGLASVTTLISVPLPVLTVTAFSVSRSYGAANPALTYTITGYVNGDTSAVVSGTAAISTAAGVTSGTGGYPITVSLGSLQAANYTFAFTAGVLTVTAAGSTTGIAAAPSNAILANAVTLTATVGSTTSGTPTGTVAFLVGGTRNGTAMLNAAGVATYSTTTLPVGTDQVSAQYLGDSNFSGSTSSAVNVTVSPQNIWVVNAGGTLSELANSGSALSSSGGGGAGIAIDNAGNVWSANASANTLSKVSSTGVGSGPFPGGGLSGATAVSIDGAGNVWITNSNGSLAQFSNAGTALTPPAGYTGGGMNSPSALAIDPAGSIWVANAGSSSVTQFLGAADPVVAPLSTATGTGTLGVKP